MGTSFNQREVDAYQATIDLAKMMSSLIKNPPDLKGPVEEAIKTLKDAKEASAKLNELRATTMTETGLAKAELAQKTAEHAKQKTDMAEVSAHLEGRERAVEAREREAAKKQNLLNERERLVVVREQTADKRHADLTAKEDDLKARETALSDKHKSLAERENKIKAAFA